MQCNIVLCSLIEKYKLIETDYNNTTDENKDIFFHMDLLPVKYFKQRTL